MRRLEIDTQVIELHEKGLNDTEIGRLLNVNNVSIKNIRERLMLPKHSASKFPKHRFTELYKEGKNDCEIARLLNISDSAVNSHRLAQNLPKIGIKRVELSYEQEQVLIGTLFGDAHLRFPTDCLTVSGEFTHGPKQIEYCNWKYGALKSLCKEPRMYKQVNNKLGRIYDKISCKILSNPVLNDYYELSYKNKVKYVSKELLYRLDSLGIAVWFMDDGYKQKSCNSYAISTNGFSDSDRLLIQQFFKEKFNIETSVHHRGITYILKHSSLIFKQLVEPYIIDSMAYKL